MKVHNDLKKLLEYYDDYRLECPLDWPESEIRRTFLTSNSLASSEPKPLTKNKQMYKICSSCDGRGSTVVFTECFRCEVCNGRGTVQITDATSR